MKYPKIPVRRNIATLLMFFITAVMLTGCASTKIVSEYDKNAELEIKQVGSKVDKFYENLLTVNQSDRSYQQYSEQYQKIQTELRTLFDKNKVRILNEESTKISESILTLWIKYKEKHKLKNNYTNGNVKLDRSRLARLFSTATIAESGKKSL